MEASEIVTDSFGDLLPEVSVLEKETSKGAETHFNSNLSIMLVDDSQSLDEIVVVGYGKKKKSDLTWDTAKTGGAEL